MPELSERDLAILTFEGKRWTYPAAKESAVRELFGLTPARYYQRLNVLLDLPEAMLAEPMTVKRLLRLRDQRRAQHPRSRAG